MGFILFFMISSSSCTVCFSVILLPYFVFRRFIATVYLCVGSSYRESIFDHTDTTKDENIMIYRRYFEC